MKQTLTQAQAVAQLLADDYANWTHEGATALFSFIEEWENETGQPIDFDPVALRCGWSEYASVDEALEDYGMNSFSELDLSTIVIALDNGGVLVEQF